jgi:predicted AAA+ superfamily ATPase
VIARIRALAGIAAAFRVHPVVALVGPRQSGKTTLARALAVGRRAEVFDLEHPVDVRRLAAPLQALERLSGLVVIDEIQRRPDLFELLRVLVDRPGRKARFLVLGSASPDLVKGASESLAGRVGFVDLEGFLLDEVGPEKQERLWLRGGLPRAYLASGDAASMAWRESFIRTFLERDIPQLGITVPSEALRRFWTMVAHYHGQVWNAAEFARSIGAAENTARRYLDILAGSFAARVLQPWHENLKKRQVKAPKVYVRDTGLLHALLGLASRRDLLGHPKAGASWEGFAVNHVVAAFRAREAYFWATHAGAELDVFLPWRGRRYGFECKFQDAPGMTRSMHVALADLSLDHLWVVYPGSARYEIHDRVTALPLSAVLPLAASLARQRTGG